MAGRTPRALTGRGCDLIGAWLEAPSLSCPPARLVRAAPVRYERAGTAIPAWHQTADVEVTGGVDTHGETHTPPRSTDRVGCSATSSSRPPRPATGPAGVAALVRHGWCRSASRAPARTAPAWPAILAEAGGHAGRGRPARPQDPPLARASPTRSTPSPPPGPRCPARRTGAPKTATAASRRSAPAGRPPQRGQGPHRRVRTRLHTPHHHRRRRAPRPTPRPQPPTTLINHCAAACAETPPCADPAIAVMSRPAQPGPTRISSSTPRSPTLDN